MIYDIAIIGAGPAGLYATKELSSQGKKIILFEKGKVGGVSTHEGCIPAKSLLYSATMWDVVNDIEKFGVHVEGKLVFDYKEIVKRKNKISQAIHDKVLKRLDELGVKLVEAFASLDGEVEDGIKISADGKTYKAKKVLLVGGSKNFVPPIECIGGANFLEARTVMELDDIPESLTVIGGGVLGVEFAALFATFGSEVELIERSDEILSSNDKELATILRLELEKKGIKFHLNSSVTKVEDKTVIITTSEGLQKKITNDQILLATGRTPLIDNLNLESLDIKLTERGAVAVNKSMQTSHPDVYACGDIIGGAMLVHAAIHEVDVALGDMLGVEQKLDYNIVPGVIYTNPEISFVGAMERTLQSRNIKYRVLKRSMTASDRYVQQNGLDAVGLIKILVGEEDDKILGIDILGYPGSEFVTIGGIAIAEGWTAEKLKKVVFPYPTVSRILRDML